MKLVVLILGSWFILMICAIINALLRVEGYSRFVSELSAHQISTVSFILVIFIFTYILFYYSSMNLNQSDAIIIGVVWFILTIIFEFIAGHYIFGNSWDHLLADYNILQGRLWSFVLVTLLFAPLLVNKLISKP